MCECFSENAVEFLSVFDFLFEFKNNVLWLAPKMLVVANVFAYNAFGIVSFVGTAKDFLFEYEAYSGLFVWTWNRSHKKTIELTSMAFFED